MAPRTRRKAALAAEARSECDTACIVSIITEWWLIIVIGKIERVRKNTAAKSNCRPEKRSSKGVTPLKTEQAQEDAIHWTNLAPQQDEQSDKEDIKADNTATKLSKEEDSLIRSEIDVPKSTASVSKPRKNPYGLTPGKSPYTEYDRPTAEECEQVHRLLSKMHGPKWRSKNPPRASAKVSGCGAVPFVVDAVLRTLLSASTTASNAGLALQGLITTFGSIDDSPDWDAVRRAPLPKVVESIKRAGLANMKGANIKSILDTVYIRNIEESKNPMNDPAEKTVIKDDNVKETVGQSPMLRMKYVENMSDEEAMTELTSLPGIGVKTAACVLMFNMGRDVFAVDTHVFRMCQWLGWVPNVKGLTRDRAFSHLEVHIPNHLKYPLHVQMVMHGRECLRCRANTSPNTEGWDEYDCPIDDFVHRTGPMKSGKRGGGSSKSANVISGRVKKANGNAKTPAKGRRTRGKQNTSDESDEREVAMDDVTDNGEAPSDSDNEMDED